jgi:hypothetical protein
MQEYLCACLHTAGIVLALNNDMVMMNEVARQTLDPGDQVVLSATRPRRWPGGIPARGAAADW